MCLSSICMFLWLKWLFKSLTHFLKNQNWVVYDAIYYLYIGLGFRKPGGSLRRLQSKGHSEFSFLWGLLVGQPLLSIYHVPLMKQDRFTFSDLILCSTAILRNNYYEPQGHTAIGQRMNFHLAWPTLLTLSPSSGVTQGQFSTTYWLVSLPKLLAPALGILKAACRWNSTAGIDMQIRTLSLRQKRDKWWQKRPALAWAPNAVCRWWFIELYSWDLCGFIKQCHPNKCKWNEKWKRNLSLKKW